MYGHAVRADAIPDVSGCTSQVAIGLSRQYAYDTYPLFGTARLHTCRRAIYVTTHTAIITALGAVYDPSYTGRHHAGDEFRLPYAVRGLGGNSSSST